MQKGFEADLQSLSEVERVRRGEVELSEEVENIHVELANRLQTVAENQATTPEVQKKVLEIQRKKLNIMKRLKENLALLDNPDAQTESIAEARPASYDEITKSFIYHNEKGQRSEATTGEIITDLDWDIEYQLDPATTPRPLMKEYLVERAKSQLRELLDKQILVSEIGSTENDEMMRGVYQTIKDKNENIENIHQQASFIAETVVKNFLRKLTIDNDLPFEIKVADVQQDVELKMDFIIHKKQEALGVEVEATDTSDIAIQYSVDENRRTHKEKQIKRTEEVLLNDNDEHIKHIALVIFPIADAYDLNRAWKSAGKVAGGPGKFLKPEVKQKLFFELLKEVFTPSEIEEYWEKVQTTA